MTKNNITRLVKNANNNSNDLLIVDSFKFRKVDKNKSISITWCWTIKSCLLTQIKNENSIVSSNWIHNYNTDKKSLAVGLFKMRVKREKKTWLLSFFWRRPIKIIRSEFTNNNFDHVILHTKNNIPKKILKVQEYLFSEKYFTI